MWVIIKTSRELHFYNSKLKSFVKQDGLNFEIESLGYINEHIVDTDGVMLNDNKIVNSLLGTGIRVFINRKDVSAHAVKEKLTGYKYFQLTPTVLY